MEDPTIPVGLLSDAVKQILADDDTERIVEDLNKSIRSRLPKALENSSPFIMTINMNGPSNGKGTEVKRRKLLRVILRSAFPCGIIFCQELPGKFVKEVVPEGCNFVVNEKEAAVVWNSQHFDGFSEGLETTDTEIKELMRKEEEKNSSENGLLSRISMVRLRPKRNPEADILAVSYHANYKKKKEVRHSLCKILLAFLDKVLEKNDISSYIIGGDFNFNTLEFELPSGVTVASYAMSPRLQEKQEKSSRFIPHKDNFIWFSKEVLKVSLSGPISFEDKNNFNSDLTEEDPEKVQEAMNEKGTEAAEATDMFDHDPVVGYYSLLIHSSPSKAVKNLSEEFKDMSLSDTSEGEKAHPATEKPTYGCFLL